MRTIKEAGEFRRDYKRESRGQHGRKLKDWLTGVVALLLVDAKLDVSYRDHELQGEWKGYRECHLAPDLLLIYRKPGDLLELRRLGSHSEIFG